ncbi:MAG TPA: superoxide dismutase [Phycisphaerales bacterium]|nr:superoxide dismutase [Phycisphaerales bacterium]
MTDHSIDRRTAIGTIAGAAALGAFAAPSHAASVLSPEALGWNKATGAYELPPLPYAYDALEPHIDAQTMRIHHDKHHAGYVRGLNRAVVKLRDIREGKGDVGLIKHWSRELAFHGSGHVNHTLFWTGMAPAGKGGGGYPAGDLAERIDRDFGTFEQFVAQFKAASKSVEGSGWGWLVLDTLSGRLLVTQTEKHQNQAMAGAVPLLGVDVWEHAYYLKYQNRRGDYITAFLNVVNWPEIARRYDAARR